MAAAANRSAYGGTPAARWVKQWVPQPVISTGAKCSLLKWVRAESHPTVCTDQDGNIVQGNHSIGQSVINLSLQIGCIGVRSLEDTLKALEEKEAEPEETKPEPTTEILFLCSFEGCGKTFIDAGALKKHAHIHGEKQYVCHYDGCGKKFLDSSKLKRHFLIHTGARDYICPHEGCGKAFSLDFNLRAHMRTHSQDNYHICPYTECGKRYTHVCKLRAHIKAHHEKNVAVDVMKHTPPPDKLHRAPKTPAVTYGSASSDRPYGCPYEGCGKAYIHEYKLNLHLRREHPGHTAEENGKRTQVMDHIMDEGSDQDARVVKGGGSKNIKRSKPRPAQKMPPAKARKGSNLAPANVSAIKQQWPVKETYEEDSEETEEDRENAEEDRWRYRGENEDDEETEDED